MTLNPGIRYIVTRESDDGTFRKGDHIARQSDGSIVCTEAEGWIDASEAAEALIGCEFVVDLERALAKEKALAAQLLTLRFARKWSSA